MPSCSTRGSWNGNAAAIPSSPRRALAFRRGRRGRRSPVVAETPRPMKRLTALFVVTAMVVGAWLLFRPLRTAPPAAPPPDAAEREPDRIAERPDTLLEARLR